MKDSKAARDQISAEKPQGNDLFAAANSGKGFYSFYPHVFDRAELTRRYIIKGGPGTGKSSLMREVAAYAEGRGMSVEYYRCSSDPDSLDGVILDGRIALLDGTAPHAMEPRLPGARDEIVNLGEFWDGERLGARYSEIVSLGARKGNCYRKAYRFLSASMEVSEINRELIAPTLYLEKMKKAARRLLRDIPTGSGFSLRPGLRNSLGMKGSVRLDTYEKQAKELYVVDDYYESGAIFLSSLIEIAREKECALQVSYQPLMPSLPDAVLFIESGICFVLGEEGEREADGRINMRRFVDRDRIGEIKTELRANRRLYDGLMQSAIDSLRDAGEVHFELEKIYMSCMDFESLRKFVRSFCQKIR